MYYIQESDKPILVNKIFNMLEVVDDKILLPISGENVVDVKKSMILVRKIKRILDKTGCKKVILSKKIKEQVNIVNTIKESSIDIIDGKWLFSVLSSRVLDYITIKGKLKKEEINISILVKGDVKDYIIENIKNIISTYKNINIVTTNIGKFRNLEKEILEKQGSMITITNNKKKSLIRSKIILNVDFTNEEINKYNIPDEAIIVNLKNNVEINRKRFNGLNINDYEIEFQDSEEFDYDKHTLYDQKDIYESLIYKKQPFEYIERKIKTDKVKIVKLIGQRTSL